MAASTVRGPSRKSCAASMVPIADSSVCDAPAATAPTLAAGRAPSAAARAGGPASRGQVGERDAGGQEADRADDERAGEQRDGVVVVELEERRRAGSAAADRAGLRGRSSDVEEAGARDVAEHERR